MASGYPNGKHPMDIIYLSSLSPPSPITNHKNFHISNAEDNGENEKVTVFPVSLGQEIGTHMHLQYLYERCNTEKKKGCGDEGGCGDGGRVWRWREGVEMEGRCGDGRGKGDEGGYSGGSFPCHVTNGFAVIV